jgi:hypothetical protein
MEWLSELIKTLTLSRALIGATFVTSGAFLGGNKLWPNYFEPLPKDWVIPVSGFFMFSGMLLVFWFIPKIWRLFVEIAHGAIKWIKSLKLANEEKVLILICASCPDQPCNLDKLPRKRGALTKLELLELAVRLSKKGLVDINQYNENLITLSAQGRKRALQMKNEAHLHVTY